MKKVMILNGAGKANGKTAAMVKTLTDAARTNGNEIREYRLQNMNIHGCLDCQGCARKEPGATDPCVQNDDMGEIYATFRKSDVIVFASPVYWWTITGTLKTAVDRLYALVQCDGIESFRKESVLLMTAGSPDFKNSLSWYAGLKQWMGMKDLGVALNDINAAREIGSEVA